MAGLPVVTTKALIAALLWKGVDWLDRFLSDHSLSMLHRERATGVAIMTSKPFNSEHLFMLCTEASVQGLRRGLEVESAGETTFHVLPVWGGAQLPQLPQPAQGPQPG